MLNISLAKEDLARQLLPDYIEELYIKLTNDLIIYMKLSNKKSELYNIMINDSSKKVLLTEYKNICNRLTYNLSSMKLVLKKILDNKSVNDLDNINIVANRNYSDNELFTIKAYVNLRKNIYLFMEYILYHLIKNEQITDSDKSLFVIAINSLKSFDIDTILENDNLEDLSKLMNLVNNYISNKDINGNMLRDIGSRIKIDNYKSIIDSIYNSYINKIRPNVK